MKINKTRMICEAAIFIAMAEILSLIKLYEFPNGGSITLEMLPIILFAARYGCGWGSLAGLVYGTITYLIGNKFSIDWTTILCDYFIGTGLWRGPAVPPQVERLLWHAHRRRAALFGAFPHRRLCVGQVDARHVPRQAHDQPLDLLPDL